MYIKACHCCESWFDVSLVDDVPARLRVITGRDFPTATGSCVGINSAKLGLLGWIVLSREAVANKNNGYVLHELAHAAFRVCEKHPPSTNPEDGLLVSSGEEFYANILWGLHDRFWAAVAAN